jgi:ribosomal protein L40E
MQCVNASCRKEVADGARFCPFCRTEQLSARPPASDANGIIVCSKCHADNPATAKACTRCGNALLTSPPEEFLREEFQPQELRDKEFLEEDRFPRTPFSETGTQRPSGQQASSASPPPPAAPPPPMEGLKVCSYCRLGNPVTALACSRCSTPFAAVVSTRPALSAGEVIVMRPGGAVWHAEEEEGEVAPGQRRPLLIMDEQVVHLAHTDRRLDPAVLQARVQQLLAAQQVPVDVALVATRWLRDTDETRPRLVAWLRHHRFSDIKLLLGVDYMGSWASIQMHVGVEPEVRQHHHVQSKNWSPPIDGIIAIVLGVIGLLIFIGIFAIAYGAWRLYTSYKKYQVDNAEYIAQHAQRERRRAEERMSRTFKIDDMRLFCTAMRSVFQSVVDDIVEQGGEVTRIEGGKGGFFQEDGVTQPAAVQRRSDAAQVGV